MSRTRCAALLGMVLCLGSAGLAGQDAQAAAAKPVLTVSPHRVSIGGYATLTGAHLPPNRFYTFLLVVPNASKPVARAFLQSIGRSNARGSFRLRIRIPVVVRCGQAAVYALAPPSRTPIQAPFTLIGCKASSRAGSPPPPPAPKKRKKHRS